VHPFEYTAVSAYVGVGIVTERQLTHDHAFPCPHA
jgi:hypothetical protein